MRRLVASTRNRRCCPRPTLGVRPDRDIRAPCWTMKTKTLRRFLRMKWLIVPATAALAAAVPGAAEAKPPTPAHAHAYERAYRRVVHLFGPRTPGRNIITDGVAAHRAATDA